MTNQNIGTTESPENDVHADRSSSTKFSFVPIHFPKINEGVMSLDWNSVTKTINICVIENENFDVCRWIEYIRSKNHETQKSPFVDVVCNSASLTFFSVCGKEMAKVDFMDISIVDHSCQLERHVRCGVVDGGLIHNMCLSYQGSHFKCVEK